jgi:hypothetical protein
VLPEKRAVLMKTEKHGEGSSTKKKRERSNGMTSFKKSGNRKILQGLDDDERPN